MRNIEMTALYIGRTFPVLIMALAISLPLQAKSNKTTDLSEKNQPSFTDQEILKNSQISYHADGGFTGVRSYGVIISCVNGKISTLKSIHNPGRQGASRQKGTMDHASYIRLWKSLKRQRAFTAQNVPAPKHDIRDEFTIDFEARVGSEKNAFRVYGIGRPEASHQFAIKTLIDSAARMQAFIGDRQKVAFVTR
jgi:hypothetical protein